MVFRSLGLKRPKVDQSLADRIPPGQYLTERWPVLHSGDVPDVDLTTWTLRVYGAIENPLSLSWAEFSKLPRSTVAADMHCVTRWSKLDMVWEGVSFRTIAELAAVTPSATHVMFHCESSYSANVPLDVALGDDVLLATHANGEPLTPEHGYPLRSIVPRRYAWKSAKWLRAIEFMTADRPGFWEGYGYHNNADYLKEERFA